MPKVSFSLFLYIFFKQKSHSKNKLMTCRINNSTKSNIVELHCRYGFPINEVEDEAEEDCEVSLELDILLEHGGKRDSSAPRIVGSDQSML